MAFSSHIPIDLPLGHGFAAGDDLGGQGFSSAGRGVKDYREGRAARPTLDHRPSKMADGRSGATQAFLA
jgi:hypothetical protein